MPRLVFDVRANHDTGVSRYGLSLLAPAAGELVEAGWRIDVVVNPDQADRARRAVDGLERQAEVHVAAEDGGFVRSSHHVRALASRADLYYTSHYLLDRLCPVPFVVTIHDVTRLRWPHLSYTDASFAARFGRTELDTVRRELAALDRWQDQRFAGHGAFTRYFAAVNQFLIARAERVLTVSHSTADELGRCLGPPSGGITIVPGGVDTVVFHRRSTTEVDAVRYLLRLHGPFLVFAGLAHPNKRFDWLVEHLLAARTRMPAGARLVAVGGHAEKVDAVRRRLTEAGAEDFVVFTGRVTDDQLAALYSGAAALISASISEGYGLPVQEALSCGCEAVVADLPVNRETSGRAAHRYPHHCGSALADLACAALHGSLKRRGLLHSPPSWRDAGHALARVLADVHRYSPRQHERIRA